jgi:hypothetical protein
VVGQVEISCRKPFFEPTIPSERAHVTRLSTVEFQGRSGQKWIFETQDLRKTPQVRAGVYIITDRYPESDTFEHQVVFVGQSADLVRVFRNHRRKDCFSQQKAACLCTYAEISEPERQDISKDLLAYYDPPCNR